MSDAPAPPAPQAAPAPPAKPPGPPPEQLARTLDWVSHAFREWYRANPPDLPPRFGKREFGFMWIAKQFFLRHKAVRSKEELMRYLLDTNPNWGTPHHAYYSTAYYKDPGAATMKEKEWLGADLIFDLDADHLPNAEKLSFTEQLVEVKKQAQKLVDEFVLGDLGFDAEHVRIVFSGGRGYHIHVHDPRVWTMDSNARREVVDHVVGRGADLDALVTERTVATRRGFQGQHERETIYVIPTPASPGWAGRYARWLNGTLEEMASLPTARAVVQYAQEKGIKGIGEKTAEAILDFAHKRDAAGRTQLQILREEGRASHPIIKKVVTTEGLGVAGVNESRGDSDEPVTADIKRLIRLPGSLHGKTGLRVTPIPVDGLKEFDPLRDAVAFDETPVRVVVSKPEKIRLGEVDYACEPGPQELPLRYAMFLTLRRRALQPLN